LEETQEDLLTLSHKLKHNRASLFSNFQEVLPNPHNNNNKSSHYNNHNNHNNLNNNNSRCNSKGKYHNQRPNQHKNFREINDEKLLHNFYLKEFLQYS